jgi:hypothetical protein
MGLLDISGLIAGQNGSTEKWKYTIQTHTELPSQRTAVSEILLHQQDEGHLVLEAQGVEVTALGTDSARTTGRSLFLDRDGRPTSIY